MSIRQRSRRRYTGGALVSRLNLARLKKANKLLKETKILSKSLQALGHNKTDSFVA